MTYSRLDLVYGRKTRKRIPNILFVTLLGLHIKTCILAPLKLVITIIVSDTWTMMLYGV